MGDKDKGKSIKSTASKKKIKFNTARRPTGVVIADEPLRVNIPPRASISATRVAPQNASTRVAPHSCYSISAPIVVPNPGYQTLQGYSHLGFESAIPSSSASQCNNLNTTSGSVGLSGLRLGSNGSEPSTPDTQHSDAHGPQPGDRDSTRRLIIEPIGYRLFSDEGMAGIILKCIGTHYNGVYPSWSTISLNAQGQMFNEFKKYYVWAPEHEEEVQVNFKLKASKCLAGLFFACRKENRIPKFMVPDRWAQLQEHWNTDGKFKKRSDIGKKARASEKGGSLHTGGAVSQLTRKKIMEKELGRPVAQEELFKVTHIKKNMNPTEEERWIEPRAQETYNKFMQRVQDYRSTQPPESQNILLTQEQTEQFWRESAGEPVRGSIYGLTEKAYQKKKSWYYCSSSSSFDGVDREAMSAMESKISFLNAELAAVTERERKRDEEIAAAKELENKRYAALQAQLKFLLDSGKIIPRCPSEDESDKEGEGDDESEGDDE